MSYNHTTVGFEAFDAFIKSLRLQGIKPKVKETSKVVDLGLEEDSRHLRTATFRRPGHKRVMVVEEYLAIQDNDCDGLSRVAIETYEDGKRPDLEKRLQVCDA